MRLLTLLLLLVVAACAEQPRACGDWPVLTLRPDENQRLAEIEYNHVLVSWALADNKALWRRYTDAFPSWGIIFFLTGEPLAILRQGEVSTGNILVQTASRTDYFWTVVEEASCR